MKLSGIDGLFTRIYRLQERLDSPPMEAAGEIFVASIRKNIDVGGRPTFKPHAASTIASRNRKGGAGPQMILRDTGAMYDGIEAIFGADHVEAGSDAVQAKRLHFGYPGHDGPGGSETPARPFVMSQSEDMDAIGELFSAHYAS